LLRRASCPPIEALHLVGQRHTRNAPGKSNLERIAFYLRRGGAADDKPGLGVVGGRAEDHGRPVPSLLVARLGIEFDPDDVPSIRDVARWHYIASLPSGVPNSI